MNQRYANLVIVGSAQRHKAKLSRSHRIVTESFEKWDGALR
jgi:hypothetical protein